MGNLGQCLFCTPIGKSANFLENSPKKTKKTLLVFVTSPKRYISKEHKIYFWSRVILSSRKSLTNKNISASLFFLLIIFFSQPIFQFAIFSASSPILSLVSRLPVCASSRLVRLFWVKIWKKAKMLKSVKKRKRAILTGFLHFVSFTW